MIMRFHSSPSWKSSGIILRVFWAFDMFVGHTDSGNQWQYPYLTFILLFSIRSLIRCLILWLSGVELPLFYLSGIHDLWPFLFEFSRFGIWEQRNWNKTFQAMQMRYISLRLEAAKSHHLFRTPKNKKKNHENRNKQKLPFIIKHPVTDQFPFSFCKGLCSRLESGRREGSIWW